MKTQSKIKQPLLITTKTQDQVFNLASKTKKMMYIVSAAPYGATGGSQRPQQLADYIKDKYITVHFSWSNSESFKKVGLGNTSTLNHWIQNSPKNIKKVYSTAFPDQQSADIITRLGNDWIVHYDCVDDWSDFDNNQWYLDQNEIDICKRANLITTTGRCMITKLLSYLPDNKKINLKWLPNSTRCEINGEYWSEKRPYDLGFVGFLKDKWIDFDLFYKLANKYKIKIIGDYPNNVKKHKNIKWTGQMDSSKIIHELSECKVGIIPFKNMKLSYAVDPIKRYDYLAAGIPTVASYMPDLEDRPASYVAYSSNEFINICDKLLRGNLKHEEIMKFARGNTALDRVNKLCGWLDEL